MKKTLMTLIAAFAIFSASAQEANQKIIIDVTSTDNEVYQSVLLTINIMAKENPSTQFDVIAYGKAVPMFMKDRSPVANQITKFKENDNIKFSACEISMRLFNIKKEQLLEGVTTIPNAVEEIVKKQKLDWGYIKSGI